MLGRAQQMCVKCHYNFKIKPMGNQKEKKRKEKLIVAKKTKSLKSKRKGAKTLKEI